MTRPSLPCTGVVLAGGAAARYGGAPKGLLRVGGVRVIDRVAEALRRSTDALLLVANAGDADEWLPGTPRLSDEAVGRGPLEGIRVALAHAGTSVLVVAWDMPFVSAPLLVALRETGETRGTAAAPQGPVGPEPLCAYYPAACLEVLQQLLDGGERRASALLERARAVVLPWDEVCRHGDGTWMFASVNTPDDLARARRRMGESP
jgi:molybdopterin-guanine dinucleotide biosynthesis protein A